MCRKGFPEKNYGSLHLELKYTPYLYWTLAPSHTPIVKFCCSENEKQKTIKVKIFRIKSKTEFQTVSKIFIQRNITQKSVAVKMILPLTKLDFKFNSCCNFSLLQDIHSVSTQQIFGRISFYRIKPYHK